MGEISVSNKGKRDQVRRVFKLVIYLQLIKKKKRKNSKNRNHLKEMKRRRTLQVVGTLDLITTI